jgi:hypothetical protein
LNRWKAVSREHVTSLLGVLGLMLTLAACATADTAATSSSKLGKALAVPADYKQQVASYFAANVKGGKILKAEIALPGMWEAPFALAGPRPIVCARWASQGPITEQKRSLVFTFENGKIAEAFDPRSINSAAGGAFDAALKEAATCGKLAYVPFPDVME